MSRDKVMGFANSPDELPFLHDIFSTVDQDKEMTTSYILQFIWMTSHPVTALLAPTSTVPRLGTTRFSMNV